MSKEAFHVSLVNKSFIPFKESNQLFIIRDKISEIPDSSFDEDNDSYLLDCDSSLMSVNVHGQVLFVVDQTPREESINLCSLLDEKVPSGHSIELVCADLSSDDSASCLALLATFWVELSESCIPQRYFGALFEISPDFFIRLTTKISAPSAVAYCRLTDRKMFTNSLHCCIVFPLGKEVAAYTVDDETHEAVPVEDVFSFFPELTLGILPGSALCTSCSVAEGLRWSAIGFDTGYVVISVSTINTNIILDRKPLKFCGPISVLQFLPAYSETVNNRERRLLVSSTLGPAAVWKYWLENDTLKWENECILDRSQMYDTVTCACVQLSMIALGTYSGSVVCYSLPYIGDEGIQTEIIGQIDIYAPILSMKVINEDEIVVLSTKGIHILRKQVEFY